MHPYIAYTLLVIVIVVLAGGIVQWRRSTSARPENRSFRHTFDDSAPRH